MPHLSHRPAAPLRPYVAMALGYRVPALPGGLHRGLPSRHVTLVLELAAPLRLTMAAPVAAHGVVGGLSTAPALIDASLPQEGLQYGLTPGGARALLGVPAGELRGQAVDLAAVIGRPGEQLVDRLRHTSGWPERFRIVDEALLRRLAAADRVTEPPEVRHAWRLIHAGRGDVRIAEVAQRVGWGRRHLSERFRLATGLTPKEAARVARFEAARELLLAPWRPGPAEVAAACGYADQQHLAREWRALAGCSVSTWLREEFPFVHDGAPDGAAASPA